MNKLNKFLQIASSMIAKRDYQLDQYAINLINNDFKGYVNLVAENNFIPNDLIIKQFNNKIMKLILQNDFEGNDNIEYAITKINFQISTKEALLIFKNQISNQYNLKIKDEDLSFNTFNERVEHFLNKYINYKITTNLKQQLLNHVKTIEFQDVIFNNFNSSLNKFKKSKSYYSSSDNYENRDIIYQLLQNYLILDINQFKKINIENYLNLSSQLKNALAALDYDYSKSINKNDVIEHFINNRDNIYKNEVNTLMNKSKVQFLGQSANISAKEKLELNFKEKLNSSYLPKSSLDIINNIQKKYESILISNPNQTFIDNADTIIKEFLPNVINKYLSIDKEYVKTMTNSQGKNAEDLLLESLNSIHTMLSNDLEIIQSHNLTNLSAHNRFLKAKI